MKRLLALLLVLTVAFCAPAAAETARRPLASGDTGDAVVELQKRLQSLGLSTGEADGIYGKQTAAGVTEAQRLLAAAGYDVAQTGEADADTLKLLFDPEAEATLRTLRLGSRGDRVRQLQSRLIDLKPVSYTHLRAHETGRNLVCRLLLEKKKKKQKAQMTNYRGEKNQEINKT